MDLCPAVSMDLSLATHFAGLEHIADDSQCDLFQAYFIAMSTPVFVKMLKRNVTSNTETEFDCEWKVLSEISPHANIIRLLGGGFNPRKFLVFEYLEGRTLSHSIHMYKSQNTNYLTNSVRYNTMMYKTFGLEVAISNPFVGALRTILLLAAAVEHLHSSGYIYRDLNPNSIGIDSEGTLKLCSFGKASSSSEGSLVNHRSMLNNAHSSTCNSSCNGHHNLLYMAPELVEGLNHTEKVDVYSFAIVAWQLAKCGKTPFREYAEAGGLDICSAASRKDFVRVVTRGGLRPAVDELWPDIFTDLLQGCWADRPSDRPSFTKIVERLNEIIELECCASDATKTEIAKSSSTWF
jgi:serine/threonine protein kinase